MLGTGTPTKDRAQSVCVGVSKETTNAGTRQHTERTQHCFGCRARAGDPRADHSGEDPGALGSSWPALVHSHPDISCLLV